MEINNTTSKPTPPRKKSPLGRILTAAVVGIGGVAVLSNLSGHDKPEAVPKDEPASFAPGYPLNPSRLKYKYYTLPAATDLVDQFLEAKGRLAQGSCVTPFTIVAENTPPGYVQVQIWGSGGPEGGFVPDSILAPVTTEGFGENQCNADYTPR